MWLQWFFTKMSPLQGFSTQMQCFCYQNIASLRLGQEEVYSRASIGCLIDFYQFDGVPASFIALHFKSIIFPFPGISPGLYCEDLLFVALVKYASISY